MEIPKKQISPIFTKNHLSKAFPAINNLIHRQVEKLKNLKSIPDGKDFGFELSLVGALLFILGYDVTSSVEKLTADLSTIFGGIQLRILFPIPYWYLFGNSKSEVRAHQNFQQLIHKRIAEIEKQHSEGENTSAISLMLKSELPKAEIIQNANQLLIAAYHTTGVTIAYCLYYLALFPEWQEKIHDEAASCGIPSSAWTSSKVFELKVVKNFLNEVMRINPTAPLIFLENVRPITLGGRTVPGSTSLYLHTNSAANSLFQDPKNFNPDRFNNLTPEQSVWVNANFGGGHRICVGMHFAEMELLTFIAVLCMEMRVFFPKEKEQHLKQLQNNFPSFARFVREPVDKLPFVFVERK